MKYPFFALIILTVILALYRSCEPAVIFTDELFIEEAAYNMAHGGSLTVPSVNGKPDLAKPPLVYWLTAPLYSLFPPHPFLRRFWMIIFGSGLVTLTYALTKLWYGKRSALWAGLLLATSSPLIYFTKTGNFDLANAFFTTLTIYFYNLYLKRKSPATPAIVSPASSFFHRLSPHYFLLLTSTSLSLGILTRSFLALTPFVVIIFHLCFYPKNRPSLFSLLTSTFLLLIFILPWHLLSYRATPDTFINQYLLLPFHHAMGKIALETPTTPFFYLKILFLFPPATFAFLQLIKTIRQPLDSKTLQLIIWLLSYGLLLFFARSRHEWYTLPLYPPLAVLAGGYLSSSIYPSHLNLQLLNYKESHHKSLLRLVEFANSFGLGIKKLEFVNLKQFLLGLFTVSMLIAAPFSLLAYPLPQSEIITAVEIMVRNSAKSDTLYLLNHPLVPATRFYPPRQVKVIKKTDLASIGKDNRQIFLLATKSDVKNQSILLNQQVLYESSRFILFKTK